MGHIRIADSSPSALNAFGDQDIRDQSKPVQGDRRNSGTGEVYRDRDPANQAAAYAFYRRTSIDKPYAIPAAYSENGTEAAPPQGSIVTAQAAPLSPSSGVMTDDEQRMALDFMRPRYANDLLKLARNYSREPEPKRKELGFALANLSMRAGVPLDRRALLARAAIAVYIGGRGGPEAAKKAAGLIAAMERKDVAAFGEYVSRDIGDLQSRVTLDSKWLLESVPSGTSVLGALRSSAGEDIAQQFAAGLYRAGGFPKTSR
jgi:hypothetical protein